MLTIYARYFDVLENVLEKLGAIELLREEGEADYQGELDVDVLLSDGRVFSYHYYYGSCSGCDDWESRDLSDNEIGNEMKNDATYFDDMEQYQAWRKTVEDAKHCEK